jgi:hypothetical protein
MKINKKVIYTVITTYSTIMKSKIKLIIMLLGLMGLLIPLTSEAQSWAGRRSPGLWDNWSINLNAGLSSFFGDLSKFDSEIMEKLTQESGPAFSGILTKHINPKIGVSGQLFYGGLKGENNSGVSFEANIIEYNVHLRINLINLFSPDNISKLGIETYGGAGQFIFKTTQYDLRNNEDKVKVKDTGTPEFVYFFGAGLSYKVAMKVGITVDVAMRQARNDYLDDFVKNNNNDYYSYISLGLTYYIDSFKKAKGYKPSGTKGRIPGILPMRRRR